MAVATVQIIIVYRVKPEEGVVHYGVYVASYRSLACKQPCGSFHHVVVIEQIVVHQIALCCVAAPHPSVALYAVNEKLACG